ncbi:MULTISPECIES: NB-ARC domain-containing protein [Leptolyngbya]|nr:MULTISPECIES: NB-ARC domain-containing protein [Leptolyngbya]MBD2371157.1 hypothetical protein [Leptolyngbya sp. FACHB-161]MBD2377625.1 hypothetical protein [Leptolyngbya sp. FACHB-238]MBD2402045.1 hypothetical protein [Leptolyngbya sp. FACHB-239]MBD2408564.1 hypothetical protein [Leptolyngbya sp. FACHB-402]ULP33810.1 NB-ARC domain-containing protein [Leptolyngbya boryana IU 594]
MPRATYGPRVKYRAKRLFTAIAAFAQDELEGVEQIPVRCSWQPEADSPTLIVRTTLRALEELCKKDGFGTPLTKPQIREALSRMEDFLNILEDVRENPKGTEHWHFKLTLWSRDTTENVNQFDQFWETKRPLKSKEQQTVNPIVASSEPTPIKPEKCGLNFLFSKSLQNQQNNQEGQAIQIHAPHVPVFVGQGRPTFGKPLQMPPLPDYFVERPEHQDAVKFLLMREGLDEPATLIVSAIHGLGGIGKSVLAAWLAHDAEVQARFCDGVLWATLGQDPDILSFLCDWIQALGDRDYKPTTISGASSHLRTLLYDKRVLLVVDDTWSPEHVEPFRVGRSGCRVLVTTREAAIADAKRYDLEEMKPEQSLELLTKKYPGKLIAMERSQAAQLAETVGHLPLALELAAAQIDDGVLFSELLEDLQAETARLETLDRPVEVSAAYGKRYSLLASLNLSVQRLSSEQQRQFAWLGVLPEDVLVTEQVTATLWQMTARQAGAALRVLRSRALLLAGVQQVGQKPTYRIHDLIHNLAKRLLTGSPEPEYEQDLPGLGMTLVDAHTKFLQRYREKTDQGGWHSLPEDSYIHSQLTWHLEQAGQVEEIHALLKERTTTGQNGWFVACESLGQTANFVKDVARAWQWADQQCETNPVGAIYWQCRYLLIYGSLNSLASNIPPELIAALVEKGFWKPNQGLAYVQQIPEARRRADAIATILPHLPKELMGEVLAVTREIQDESVRTDILRALVPHLPELVSETLAVTREIQDKSARAHALCALVPHLPELVSETLAVAREIQDKSARADALRVLIPHLSGEWMGEALAVTREIQDEFARASALCNLVPYLPGLVGEALAVTREIQDEFARASALCNLVPYLPGLVGEALAVTREISNESNRIDVLRALIPYLSGEWRGEVLTVIREIGNESARADVLCALVPHLSEELMGEALAVTRAIQFEYFRAFALRTLVPHLSEELLDEALVVMREIGNETMRADVLCALVPHLPELVGEALAVTREIGNESARASALCALVPHLPELAGEALSVAREVEDESARAHALRALVPHLSEGLMSEALAVTREIQDKFVRANVLRALVPHLSEELMGEALAMTREIGNKSARADVLCALVPRLPELAGEALAVTREIGNESARNALRALVPHLSEGLMGEALAITREIGNESARADVLCALVPRLPELAGEALAVTREIGNESARASALCALVPHLPESSINESLECVKKMRDLYYKAKALQCFTQQLTCISTTPRFWSETLHAFSALHRYELIATLANLTSFVLTLGGVDSGNYGRGNSGNYGR